MAESWLSVPAESVRVGDQVRLGTGQIILVSKVEDKFMGMETMVAFIEDTESRWFKQPVPKGTDVEVRRAT